MRTSLLRSLILLGAAAPLAAQSENAGPAFNGLRTPVSPAFLLLGVAPTVVERPNTPSDFALSVLNRGASLTNLPRDVALEFSPYWLIKHPTLTWQQDATRDIANSVARTMTISVATAEVGTTARPVTGLAVGFRAAPVSGHVSQSSISQLQRLGNRLAIESAVLANLQAQRQGLLATVRDQEIAAATGDSARQAALNRFDAARLDLAKSVMQSAEYKAAVDSTEQMFRDLAVTREGFVLEIAGGAALQAPGGVADSAKLTRWGAWMTAGYEGKTLSFVAVSRVLGSSVDTTFNAIDLGTRVLYTAGRYALSAEGSFRSFTGSAAPANQYRIAALVDFELQKGVWVTGTFGRDYSATGPGSLIAHIGLSMNVAGNRIAIPLR